MNEKKYYAARLFTGTAWLNQQVVTVRDGQIIKITPAGNDEDVSARFEIMAPAFIDLQIYGAREKLFSVYPEAASLQALYEHCLEGGTSHFQPTVATNSYEVFYKSIDAVRDYRNNGGRGCIGLHIEGPWLSPVRKGAHIESFIHSPSVEQARNLLEYGKGVITMITLAPEVCSKEVQELVHSYGVKISGGHSNAAYEEALAAFDGLVHTTTHLYNAMSPLQHRAPGMVGAIFNHANVMASIIPDGYHVDFAAVRIAKTIMQERLFVITDAVTGTTSGPYPHQLAGDKYEAGGILSGSALSMAQAAKNLVTHTGSTVEEAFRMCSLYPARVMGMEQTMGKIETGYPVNIVCLNAQLEADTVLTEG
ncbi:N-acetylglucosamine-6-phosphate deacetylase [Sediminibacterium ginsengisoli]|uniref:N-acetylglucosamine-6-phosphate deacetylase n=1 Tax=Sediminibacterium ginsengisoli TaxID=413434 RepID=A0A1T4MAY9_9BACT|nr:N-acetylglucosamine-6-phosphate deacetylase [Sediminibacterium ginsengisoli]SJZ64189.1 N-acetylglucosamine-6-phosphate deacetylase [Sediminibacterium ginsengisoli]